MTCPHCDGGWKPVAGRYAAAMAGIGRDTDPEVLSRFPAGTAERAQYAAYRAHLDSVYPCPSCRPRTFERWESGCYRPGHTGCERCRR